MSTPDKLQETILYHQLSDLVNDPHQLQKETESRRKALSLVDDVCREASQTMKMVPTLFPEYTLHDEIHLVRVVHLMGVLLKESGSLEHLSYLELTILILAAYLHDIGMVPPREKVEKILESSEFSLFRKIRQHELEGLRELSALLENPGLSEREKRPLRLRAAEIEQSILTEYLRTLHGELGAEYIIQKWSSDSRWIFEGYDIAEMVAWVCKGHTFHPQQLVSEHAAHFPLDKLIGQIPVNILYCTIILRLADILDFDRERTPHALYENISPRNTISVKEWNKHRSVTGWSISSDRIVFECECAHPVYEKTLRKFLDYIDFELQQCRLIVQDFPHRDQIAERYTLKLHPAVDRTHIAAKDDAYSYIDLLFSLSHEEVMKLLMGPNLWDGPSLCIRELIQNGYDAIRHRRALERVAGNEWKQGKITLTQRLNREGHLELACRDNGMGMNRDILKNYFFRIGRSYYRSPEFKQERIGLKEKNVDFDPTSQFGIGIVSTFLIGNSLQIRTQHYLGPNRGCEESLIVEVDGVSKMAVTRILRNGEPRPGTEITVIGKKMSQDEASDDYHDPLRLLEAVQYYAAALDIPVEVITEPPFNSCHVTIQPPSRPLRLRMNFEDNPEIPPKHYLILERNFSSMCKESEGTARIFFLHNSKGRVCVRNNWGHWAKGTSRGTEDRFRLVRTSDAKAIEDLYWCRSVLAQDGILVSEQCSKRSHLHFYSSRYPAPNYCFPGSYFVNLLGSSKLPLKPNRAPYQPSLLPRGKEETTWWEFEQKMHRFISEVLEDVLRNPTLRPQPEDFWSIVKVYGLSLYGLSKETAHKYVPLPCVTAEVSSPSTWETLNAISSRRGRCISLLPRLSTPANIDSVAYIPLTGLNLGLCDDETLKTFVTSLIRSTTIMRLEGQEIRYEINPRATPFKRLSESHRNTSAFDWEYYQVYADDLKEYLSVNNPAMGMNYTHPVTRFILKYRGMTTDRYKWFRWGIHIVTQKLANNKDFDERQPSEWGKSTLRDVKLAINHWKKVKWDELPKNVKPPYKIFFPSSRRSYDVSLESLQEMIRRAGIKEGLYEKKLANLE